MILNREVKINAFKRFSPSPHSQNTQLLRVSPSLKRRQSSTTLVELEPPVQRSPLLLGLCREPMLPLGPQESHLEAELRTYRFHQLLHAARPNTLSCMLGPLYKCFPPPNWCPVQSLHHHSKINPGLSLTLTT